MIKFKDNYILVGLLSFAVALFLPVVFVHASAVTNSVGIQTRAVRNSVRKVMAPTAVSHNKQMEQGQKNKEDEQSGEMKQENNQEKERTQKQERTQGRQRQEDSENSKGRRKANQIRKVNQINGVEHRSVVANAVQNLLIAANYQKGTIGEEVKKIAEDQNSLKDTMSSAIEKVSKRSGFKTFLIGSDYKNLGQLRSTIAKTNNQLTQLKNLVAKTTDTMAKAILRTQIADLQQEQQKVTNFVNDNSKKFSLFGWFVKIFNK